METLKNLQSKAKNVHATIILPETNLDKRVYAAAKIILKKKLANLIVFGREDEFDATFKTPACQIIDINTYPKAEFTKQLFDLRQAKGLTKQKAAALMKKPMYFAMMLVLNRMADGVVAGACHTTADVLLPALQIIKTKQGESLVTGSMLMLKKGCKPLLFGDVSLVESPDSNMLKDIAIANAKFMQNVVGEQPKVALLSYSTHGSAQSEMVQRVKNATKMAQQSGFLIDGELQADAALDSLTAKQKGVEGAVAGNANVLIFPDLNAGNIAYKLTSRLADYQAIGPIMLNFKHPVNDLSRGATVDEIVDTVLITKLLVNC